MYFLSKQLMKLKWKSEREDRNEKKEKYGGGREKEMHTHKSYETSSLLPAQSSNQLLIRCFPSTISFIL